MNNELWINQFKYKQIHNKSPILTIVGHVDHGKTTLVEQLLKHNHNPQELTSKEPGGISQNIALYKLPYGILVDTPGHEVFSSLRQVLMSVSDIIILVIACDDGVQPETINIIQKAPENACFIVVINKIDKGVKNLTTIYGKLASYGILVDSNGGDILTVQISAKNGTGINELIETINLQWELIDNNKTDKKMHAIGYIMDCSLKQGLGYKTSILIKAGTLNQGDDIIVNGELYRIKLIQENNKNIKSCSVDQVVEIIGITKPIFPGTKFCSVSDKSLINQLLLESKIEEETITENTSDLKFILQTNSIIKLDTLISIFKKKGVKIIETNVSHLIKSSTIELAKKTNATVILWGDFDDKAIKTLIHNNIKYVANEIIYAILESLETPKKQEEIKEILGSARIKKIFIINGTKIAGCGVLDGKITIGNKCIIRRNNEEMAIGHIISMKREKDTIREAVKNTECGLIIQIDEIINKTYEKFNELDEIDCFKIIHK